MKMIKWEYSKKLNDKGAIDKFEKKYSIEFPSYLKKIMSENNGGFPTPYVCTLYDEEELKLVQFELSRDYEYDVDEIKAAAVVDVLIKGSGSEGEANWTHEIYCVTINGKWYIHRPGFS